MIAFVPQERPTFCFLACLESFLAENGQLLSQRAILKRGGDAFGKNENDLGGFAAGYFPLLEKEFGLVVKGVEKVSNSMPRDESVFVLCKWDGRDDLNHWVRMLKADDQECLLMNPEHKHCPQEMKMPEFRPWILGLFLVKIRPPVS